jgi:hypothetical protein
VLSAASGFLAQEWFTFSFPVASSSGPAPSREHPY